MKFRHIASGLFAALLFLPTLVHAQSSSPSNAVPLMTGVGSVEITRQPNTLLMTLTLRGRGPDVIKSLESLNARKEKALDKLNQLGANEDTIEFGEPTLSSGMSQQQQQMQQMLRQHMRASGRDEVEVPDVLTVSRQLSAEWPLSAKTSDELLIQVVALTKKIREADVAGSKEADELTPEEQELAEEMEGLQQQMGMSEDESDPGDPQFVYLSKISEEEYNAGISDAFKKAEKKAGLLATATGTKLGPLWTVAVRDSESQARMQQRNWQYNRYGRAYAEPDVDLSEGQRAAIGYQPGEVTYTIYVQAAFRLETEGGETEEE